MTDSSRQRGKKTSSGLVVLIVIFALILGGLTWWLVEGDRAFGGALNSLLPTETSETTPPPTAPVIKGTIQKNVTGAGEVKSSDTEKIKPAKWRYFASYDAPKNKLVRAGEPLITYTNGGALEAPYDLVVKSHNVPKAREALEQDEHFVEVERVDTVHISMPVSEHDLASLAEGQNVTVSVGNQAPRAGVIKTIDQVGTYNASGSKFTVIISVPNDGSIWLGMSASLSVKVAEATDVFTIPVSAVQGSGDTKTLTLLNADGSERTVSVTTGLSDGIQVEVSGDIKEGDAVVLQDLSPSSGASAGGGIAMSASSL